MTTECRSRALLGGTQASRFRICCLSILALLFLSTGVIGAPPLLQHCCCTPISWQQHTCSRWAWPREGDTSVPFLWAGGMEWQGQLSLAKHFCSLHSCATPVLVFDEAPPAAGYCVFKGSKACLAELRTEMWSDQCHLWLWLGYCCDATSKSFPHHPEGFSLLSPAFISMGL